MHSRFFPKDYVLIWLALVSIGLFCRPLIPVDETRVVSVAWEMWQRGNFLVPHINGLPYSHKPPFLQWCIHLSWLLFGVNEWTARLIAPLFALGNLVLTAKLSRRMWPDDETSRLMAPLLLLTLPVWALWTSLTLYDMLTTFFTLLGLLGIIRAAQGEIRLGWLVVALALGCGLLSKGPAIFIMILPAALLAPWWLKTKPKAGWRSWYSLLLGAALLGALLALTWAVPAGLVGGDEYRGLIFWGQTAGRISHSFAHQRPFWWYLAVLPVVCFPLTFWPLLWRSAKGLNFDFGMRFCLVQSVSALALFSLISAKQIHYLLPIFPTLALLASRAVSLANLRATRRDQAPFGLLVALLVVLFLLLPLLSPTLTAEEAAAITLKTPLSVKLLILGVGLVVLAFPPITPLNSVRVMAWGMLGLMLGAHLIFRQVGWAYYSMQTFSDRLSTLENDGTPIAYWGKYNGDFNFLGRLQHPLDEINDKQKLLDWINAHNQGYVILIRQPDPMVSEEGAAFAQFYRGSRRIMLFKSAELSGRLETLKRVLN